MRYSRVFIDAIGYEMAPVVVSTAELEARVEAVSRPSGFTSRDTPGFRVRVVSSYLADLLRQYAGGDAHHMRQQFPRVVMSSLDTFRGFLDGYADGDGYRVKEATGKGRGLISANTPFLQEECWR